MNCAPGIHTGLVTATSRLDEEDIEDVLFAIKVWLTVPVRVLVIDAGTLETVDNGVSDAISGANDDSQAD